MDVLGCPIICGVVNGVTFINCGGSCGFVLDSFATFCLVSFATGYGSKNGYSAPVVTYGTSLCICCAFCVAIFRRSQNELVALQVLSVGVAFVMKVMIILNSAWNLLNFRSGLIKALLSAGHTVVLAAPADSHVPALRALGARFLDIPIKTHSINPITDLVLLWRLLQLLKLEKPDVLLAYTVKPNIYGSLAAHWLGVPVINNISGLGSVFINGGWIARLLKSLYRLALTRSKRVFFQNSDDLHLFLSRSLVKQAQTGLLPGSGVDLNFFKRVGLPTVLASYNLKDTVDRPFVFLLVARMLTDKGVEEYVQAASSLKSIHPNCEFGILGFFDINSPAAISIEKIQSWVEQGAINYWGASYDVRLEISNADCVVLPSYREGTPRSLLEAAAMGRPLVATDVPGCRDVVIHGVNGFLCKPSDSNDLAHQMSIILQMAPDALLELGKNSRLLVEKKFDERIVIEKYFNAINALE